MRPSGLDQRSLGLSMGPPQHEHLGRAISQEPDDLIRQGLPATLSMTARLALFHCQDGIEQENPRTGPSPQVATRGLGPSRIAASHFLENITQTGRNALAWRNGESQTFGLTETVVGVLAQDDEASGMAGGFAQGAKDVGGIHNSPRRNATINPGDQAPAVWGLAPGAEQ